MKTITIIIRGCEIKVNKNNKKRIQELKEMESQAMREDWKKNRVD